MRCLIALPLVLALGIPAIAKEKAPDPATRIRAVAPFLDDLTFVVAHMDLSRLDLDPLLTRFGKLAQVEEKVIARVKEEAATQLKTLRSAGIREVYGVVSLIGIPTQPRAFLVVPLTADADAEVVSKALQQALHLRSVRIGNAVVAGEGVTLRELKTLKPATPPELAKAFAAAGEGPVQVAVLLPRSLRRALEETLPNLPEELGGGPITTLTQGFSWAAVSVRLEPALSIRVIVQARDAAAAKKLAGMNAALLRKFCQTLAKDKDARSLVESPDAFKEMLTPKIDDSRLTLALNEKQLTAVLLPLVVKARRASKQAESINNLKQLALAMHNYLGTYRTFPAHASYDKQGRPLLSWRVHLLPYLEQDSLYKEFHFNEPWDSAQNKKLIAQMPAIFRAPRSKAGPGKTTYVVPVGKATMFPPGPKGVAIREVTDGTSNTLLIVEADDAHAVVWTKPEDLTYDPKKPLEGLGGKGRGRFLAAFADGSVRTIGRTIKLDDLRALFTRNGGEAVGDIP